jgi:hypothetical protein
VLDAPALTVAGRTLALAATAFVVLVALAGPSTEQTNLAPWALFVTFWVGLVPASVLLGPVWRRFNPLRTVHAALCRLTRTDPDGRRVLPRRLGYWPAAAWLTAFVWLELVAPGRSDPRLVGALILAYGAVNVALAWVYGRQWFTHGDGFEAYSSLLARMCPLGRRADGVLVRRTPLTGLMRVTGEPVLAGTAGLAAAIGAVGLLYVAAMRASAVLSGGPSPGREMPGRFAATLLPIALGYAVAHYFSFLVLEGQMTVILAGDPFGTGLNLLGSTGHRVDYDLAGPTLIAQVQVNAIVLGHIAATIAAHDLALRTGPPGPAAAGRVLRGQLPIMAAMVALTCAGLFALLSG